MGSLVGWIVLIATSVAAIAYGASIASPPVVLAAAGLTAVIWAALALGARTRSDATGASRSRVAATSARYMGLIWTWGAIALFVVYFFILDWREWWHFCLAFGLVGAISLGYAWMLDRDAAVGREDATMLSLGRYLAIGQLVGMLATVVGLAIDPDKELTWIREGDWAGNIIFLFGAAALIVVTAHALYSERRPAA